MGRFTGLLGLVVILGCRRTSSPAIARQLSYEFWRGDLDCKFAFAVLVLRNRFREGVSSHRAASMPCLDMPKSQRVSVCPLGTRVAPSASSSRSGAADRHLYRILFLHPLLSGVMQFIVRWMAVGMLKTMGERAESLNVAGQYLHGQTEAPLTIKLSSPA